MINQRRNDERRSLEAARLLLLEKTIDTQEKHIKALESLLARAGSDLLCMVNCIDEELDVSPDNPVYQLIAEIDAILPATGKPAP